VPSIPRFVPASKLLADARSPRIPTIQEVRNELQGLQSITSIVFDASVLNAGSRNRDLAESTSRDYEAIGTTQDVDKRQPGQKSHRPQSHAGAKKRSEAISAAIKAASPRSMIQRPCDLAICNGLLSPRSYERYPKLTSGFQYSVDNARPIVPLSRPPTASSDIGLRVPRRPQSGRPNSSFNFGIGDDCIVASSPRILSTRSNAVSPRSNSAVGGDQFARASQPPRKSPDKMQSSVEQSLTRPDEERKEEGTQRPSTASNCRAPTGPTGTQARPSTANANLNPTPPRTPSPRKVCTPGSGPVAKYVQGLTLSCDLPSHRKMEGETRASDQWINCETHSRFVPVQHRRQSAKMRAEARDQVRNANVCLFKCF
jgi:hypothetical protein